MTSIIKKKYRTDQEIDQWKQRDPIQLHTARLLDQGMATEQEIAQIHDEEKSRVDEATKFARESPYPEPSELFEDMFAVPIPID